MVVAILSHIIPYLGAYFVLMSHSKFKDLPRRYGATGGVRSFD